MRYDTPVYFQKVTPGKYDPKTGNYAKDIIAEVKVYANVTDTGTETLRLIYGQLKQGSKVIRLQNSYDYVFDSIRIGDDVYGVDFIRKLKPKAVFIVSEVQ